MFLFLAVQDGLLNERPTASREEYERLWQVNCGAVRQRVATAAQDSAIGEAWQEVPALERCAMLDSALEGEGQHQHILEHLIAWQKADPADADEQRAELLRLLD